MKDFLFTLLAWLITLPFIIGTVAFAVYNQDPATFVLNPFRPAATLPLYVPVLTAVAFGFLFGSVMTWAAMGRLRKERRNQKKKIKTLERQIETAGQTATPKHNYALIPSAFKDK